MRGVLFIVYVIVCKVCDSVGMYECVGTQTPMTGYEGLGSRDYSVHVYGGICRRVWSHIYGVVSLLN